MNPLADLSSFCLDICAFEMAWQPDPEGASCDVKM